MCSDFGAPNNKVWHCFHCFPIYFPMKWWDRMPSLFSECWALSQHSPLSLSSRGFLDPIHFLPLGWYHLHIWGYWYFSWQSWFRLVLLPVQHLAWCTLHMAPHSSTLAWKIPWMEPGRLQSMRSLRVGHDWATSFSLFTFMHWRRKWQPTPVFLPGESQGWGAWWAAFYGVAQSQTQLKWLSSSSSTLHMLNKQGDSVKHHNRVFQKVVKVKWHH